MNYFDLDSDCGGCNNALLMFLKEKAIAVIKLNVRKQYGMTSVYTTAWIW